MGTITYFGDRTSGAFLIIPSVSRTKITTDNCFQQGYISSCTLLPLRCALFLNNASGLQLTLT